MTLLESNLHQRFWDDMRLKGLAEKTRIGYVQAVKRIEGYWDKPAEALTAEDLRSFFLWQLDRGLAASSVMVSICASKCLVERTLKQDWSVWGIEPMKQPRKLPRVLSIEEVHEVIGRVGNPFYRTAIWTLYECGLRCKEVIKLVSDDIDRQRGLIFIRCGKGQRDRYVALSRPTLQRLEAHWRRYRPEYLLFYGARGKGSPLNVRTLQRAFKRAVRSSSLTKDPSLHTLRHCYATHLLEQGVSLRSIQAALGHKRLQTTQIYTHIAQPSYESVRQAVEKMAKGK